HISDSFCATVRPTMSVLPPARNGTTSRTGLVGYVCALAAPAVMTSARAINFPDMMLPLRRFLFWRQSESHACRSFQNNQSVGGDHALTYGPHEQRIDVDFRDAIGMIDCQQRQARQRGGERLDVEGRLAAEPFEQCCAFDLAYHFLRRRNIERREAARDVLKQFRIDAAQAEYHDRAEEAVIDGAGDDFETARHFLDRHAVDARTGIVL